MIVVDASAVLEVLLQTPNAAAVSERLFRQGEVLIAPHLLDLEVAQVLRRYNAAGVVGERRGREALADFADLALTRYSHDVLLPRIWELRLNVTAYDAAYLALAELMHVPLITRDQRLASARGHSAIVELL